MSTGLTVDVFHRVSTEAGLQDLQKLECRMFCGTILEHPRLDAIWSQSLAWFAPAQLPVHILHCEGSRVWWQASCPHFQAQAFKYFYSLWKLSPITGGSLTHQLAAPPITDAISSNLMCNKCFSRIMFSQLIEKIFQITLCTLHLSCNNVTAVQLY